MVLWAKLALASSMLPQATESCLGEETVGRRGLENWMVWLNAALFPALSEAFHTRIRMHPCWGTSI